MKACELSTLMHVGCLCRQYQTWTHGAPFHQRSRYLLMHLFITSVLLSLTPSMSYVLQLIKAIYVGVYIHIKRAGLCYRGPGRGYSGPLWKLACVNHFFLVACRMSLFVQHCALISTQLMIEKIIEVCNQCLSSLILALLFHTFCQF